MEQLWVTRSPAEQQQIGSVIQEQGRAAMARADEDRKRVHTGSARGSPAKRQQQHVRAQYEDLDRRHRRQRQAGQRRETNAQPREGHEWVWMQNGAPWCAGDGDAAADGATKTR